MNFEMALGALRVGAYVRRPIWEDGDYIFLHKTDAATCIEVGPSEEPIAFIPTMYDLLGEDWVVIANTPLRETTTQQENTNESI